MPGAGDWPLCSAVARGGPRVPHGIGFSSAPRQTGQPAGSAVAVPFSYAPPTLAEREFVATQVNSPQVLFGKSTRVPLYTSTTSAEAGPGAYDVRVEALSTKPRIVADGSFPTARREGVAKRLATAAGPGAYGGVEKAWNAVKPRLGAAAGFARASREVRSATEGNPGPRPVQYVLRSAPGQPFTKGPGHQHKAGAFAASDALMHDGVRPYRATPAQSFTKSQRW